MSAISTGWPSKNGAPQTKSVPTAGNESNMTMLTGLEATSAMPKSGRCSTSGVSSSVETVWSILTGGGASGATLKLMVNATGLTSTPPLAVPPSSLRKKVKYVVLAVGDAVNLRCPAAISVTGIVCSTATDAPLSVSAPVAGSVETIMAR